MFYQFIVILISYAFFASILAIRSQTLFEENLPCHAVGQTIIPGTYYLDAENCTVYFCEKLMNGKNELQIHLSGKNYRVIMLHQKVILYRLFLCLAIFSILLPRNSCFLSSFFKTDPPPKPSNRTHCEISGQKIEPGDYYLDPMRCIVLWCRKAPIRYAEIDQYRCFGLDQLIYGDIYEDCQEHECAVDDWDTHLNGYKG